MPSKNTCPNSKSKSTGSSAPRVMLANPLLPDSAFARPEEEDTVRKELSDLLKEAFTKKISDKEVNLKAGRTLEEFFKMAKAERKSVISEERSRLSSPPSKPHLRRHLKTGLRQCLRAFQRGQLRLLVLDKGLKRRERPADAPTALECAIALAERDSNCAVIALHRLGADMCETAMGFHASAVGVCNEAEDVGEFERLLEAARRIKPNGQKNDSGNREKNDAKTEALSSSVRCSKSNLKPSQLPNLLLKRQETGRVFQPKVDTTVSSSSAGDFLAFSSEEDSSSTRAASKRSLPSPYTGAKMLKVDSTRKKKK